MKMRKTMIKLHIKSRGSKKKPKNKIPSYLLLFVIICVFCINNYLRSTDDEVSIAILPRFKSKLGHNNVNLTRVETDSIVSYRNPAIMNKVQPTSPLQDETTTPNFRPITASKDEYEDSTISTAVKAKLSTTNAIVHMQLKSAKPARKMIVSIGEPVVHRIAGNPIGAWMKDQSLDNDYVYVLENYVKNNKVKVYTSEVNETLADFHYLPYYWGGTGHVIMGGNLYFSKYNSDKIVKYSFKQRDVVLEKSLPGAGFANTCPYQWAGSSDVDLAADSEGLWVIYATEANEWNITISRLDKNTLEVTKTWRTSYTKRWAGNAFIADGILYALKRYDSYSTTLNYAFDTRTNSVLRPNIAMTIRNQFLTMLDYNYRERRLYAWDKGELVTYDVKIS